MAAACTVIKKHTKGKKKEEKIEAIEGEPNHRRIRLTFNMQLQISGFYSMSSQQ